MDEQPQQRAVLTELAAVLDNLGPALDPVGSDGLLRSITSTAREIFGAAACSLALLSPDQSELVFTTASGQGAESVLNLRIPSNQGIAGYVVMSEQPIVVSDLRQDPRFATDVADSTGYVPQAILAVPVSSPRRLLGVIEVLDRDASRPAADQDMRLLSVFADQAALAIENSRAFSELGRATLRAVAEAAPGTSLADALAQAEAESDDADERLLALAGLFAQLKRAGEREHELALSIVSQVLRYTGGRGRRRT
jgi:GAF domain-containing protein